MPAASGVVIVAGPPCSGKTTYVRRHAAPNDPVLDWDDIWTEIHGPGPRPTPGPWDPLRQAVEMEFRRRFDQVDRGWVIRCAPSNRHRALMRRVKGARSIVLAIPIDECVRRLMLDDSRPGKRGWVEAIELWWMHFKPSSSDQETLVQNWILG